MRGRKPKERDSYVLRMGDGTLVSHGEGNGIRRRKTESEEFTAWMS